MPGFSSLRVTRRPCPVTLPRARNPHQWRPLAPCPAPRGPTPPGHELLIRPSGGYAGYGRANSITAGDDDECGKTNDPYGRAGTTAKRTPEIEARLCSRGHLGKAHLLRHHYRSCVFFGSGSLCVLSQRETDETISTLALRYYALAPSLAAQNQFRLHMSPQF